MIHRSQLFCHNQGIYLNEYKQVTKHYLFHDGGSSRIVTSPLIFSANQLTGFCIIGTSIMKDSRRSSSTYTESLFLHVVSHNLVFSLLFFFLSGIGQQVKEGGGGEGRVGEGEGYLLISFLPLPPASQTLRHYLGYCCRELTSAHNWQPGSNMGPLVNAR